MERKHFIYLINDKKRIGNGNNGQLNYLALNQQTSWMLVVELMLIKLKHLLFLCLWRHLRTLK